MGLELVDVAYAYEGAPALHGVSLRLEPGAVTAVVGANGSGKSTLLDLVAGVRSPATGTISRGHARRAAFVPQTSATPDELPITVRDCVAVGRFARAGLLRRLGRADRERIDEVMSLLDVAHLAGRRMRDLSGGQRQRTLVAQGLAQDSDLLVLDEPDSALDAAGSTLLQGALTAAARSGATVVVATHDPTFPADRLIRLEQGRVQPG